MLVTFKLVHRRQFFDRILSCLLTSYHTLSHLILQVGKKYLRLATFKLVPRPQFFITSYHALLLLITPYQTSSFRLRAKLFSFGNFKISSQAPILLSNLITPCHTLSHLITSYPLGLKQNYFHLATLKLVPRLLFFYYILSCLLTPYHTLSNLILQVESKTVFIWQL